MVQMYFNNQILIAPHLSAMRKHRCEMHSVICSPTFCHPAVSVVNRLMKLLSQLASVTAREEAALQQARAASTQSERLMDENADLRVSSIV